jgi:hypothetical protein
MEAAQPSLIFTPFDRSGGDFDVMNAQFSGSDGLVRKIVYESITEGSAATIFSVLTPRPSVHGYQYSQRLKIKPE